MTKFIPQHIADPNYKVEEVPEVVKQAQDIIKGKKVPEITWNNIIVLKNHLHDLMSEAGIDKSDIESYISDVDYDLKDTDIVRAFKDFIASNRSMLSKERYLFPVFSDISSNVNVKKVRTASEIISEKKRLSLGIPAAQIYGKGGNYVLKPEEELPHLVPVEEVRAEYVEKMRKNKEIKCELCGEVIRPDQMQGWWLSIYPAHLTCIHAEFNRRAAAAGRRIPFPELSS